MLLPEKTLCNKILNKQQFIKMAGLSAVGKNEFNANVERLFISNILRKDTINLEGSLVKEIDFFELRLKNKKCSDNLIKEIDTAIPKRIVYVLRYKDEIRLVVSYKEKSATSEKYKVLKTYRSDWQKADTVTLSINGLNLDAVFNSFIEQIADGKVEVVEETTIKEAVEKSVEKEKLQRKIDQLTNKMNKEKQFNKQLQIKEELKQLKKELEKL